jgi:hypothetical protein
MHIYLYIYILKGDGAGWREDEEVADDDSGNIT